MSIKRCLASAILSTLAFTASATITVTGIKDFGGATVGTSCSSDRSYF